MQIELRKGRASRNKCYALSATEGYISGWLKPYPEYSSLWHLRVRAQESRCFDELKHLPLKREIVRVGNGEKIEF